MTRRWRVLVVEDEPDQNRLKEILSVPFYRGFTVPETARDAHPFHGPALADEQSTGLSPIGELAVPYGGKVVKSVFVGSSGSSVVLETLREVLKQRLPDGEEYCSISEEDPIHTVEGRRARRMPRPPIVDLAKSPSEACECLGIDRDLDPRGADIVFCDVKLDQVPPESKEDTFRLGQSFKLALGLQADLADEVAESVTERGGLWVACEAMELGSVLPGGISVILFTQFKEIRQSFYPLQHLLRDNPVRRLNVVNKLTLMADNQEGRALRRKLVDDRIVEFFRTGAVSASQVERALAYYEAEILGSSEQTEIDAFAEKRATFASWSVGSGWIVGTLFVHQIVALLAGTPPSQRAAVEEIRCYIRRVNWAQALYGLFDGTAYKVWAHEGGVTFTVMPHYLQNLVQGAVVSKETILALPHPEFAHQDVKGRVESMPSELLQCIDTAIEQAVARGDLSLAVLGDGTSTWRDTVGGLSGFARGYLNEPVPNDTLRRDLALIRKQFQVKEVPQKLVELLQDECCQRGLTLHVQKDMGHCDLIQEDDILGGNRSRLAVRSEHRSLDNMLQYGSYIARADNNGLGPAGELLKAIVKAIWEHGYKNGTVGTREVWLSVFLDPRQRRVTLSISDRGPGTAKSGMWTEGGDFTSSWARAQPWSPMCIRSNGRLWASPRAPIVHDDGWDGTRGFRYEVSVFCDAM